MVDLVQSEDGGEFLIDEGVYDSRNGFWRPMFQRFFDAEMCQCAGDDLRRTSVAGELILQSLDGVCLFAAELANSASSDAP